MGISPPELDWSERGECRAANYGDAYWSRGNAIDEATHAFLRGNDIHAKLQTHNRLFIGETGFGTGLNFLLTWNAWKKHAPGHASLHYVSFEGHPMSAAQLARSLDSFPELEPQRKILIDSWTAPAPGIHRRWFEDGRVTLDLHFGQIQDMLLQLDARMHAWYLDGFAPSCNDAMWSDNVLQHVARCTAQNGSVATYTAAGHVRRSLQDAGFQMTRTDGFGEKRHMLSGVKTTPNQHDTRPYFARPATENVRDVTIIGAGIAGTSVACALARRGINVQLVNSTKNQNVSAELPAAIIRQRFAAAPDAASQLSQAGISYIHHLAIAHGQSPGALTGTLAVLSSETALKRANARLDYNRAQGWTSEHLAIFEPEDVQQQTGWPVESPCLWSSGGGAVNPSNWLKSLQQHPLINCLSIDDPQAACNDTSARVIDARGMTIAQHLAPWIPIIPVRGQLIEVERQTSSPDHLQIPLTYGGFCTPTNTKRVVLGTTHDRDDEDIAPRTRDDKTILQSLSKHAPMVSAHVGDDIRRRWVGIRATTPDRLPCVGPIPQWQWAADAYAPLRIGQQLHNATPMEYQPNRWLIGGFGSQGLSNGPLCGELLASLMLGEPLPLGRDIVDQLLPQRFLIRQLRRDG